MSSVTLLLLPCPATVKVFSAQNQSDSSYNTCHCVLGSRRLSRRLIQLQVGYMFLLLSSCKATYNTGPWVLSMSFIPYSTQHEISLSMNNIERELMAQTGVEESRIQLSLCQKFVQLITLKSFFSF